MTNVQGERLEPAAHPRGLDQDGQVAPLALIFVLPVLLLAAMLVNTGDLLDQKIQSQEAADAAARAAATWAARTLNFLSATNCFQTKTFALISVLDGAALASESIAAETAIAEAATVESWLVLEETCDFTWFAVLACIDLACCTDCLFTLTPAVLEWVSKAIKWQGRASSWSPRLWSAMSFVSGAQEALVDVTPAIMAWSVNDYYQRNSPSGGGLAFIASALPTGYLPVARRPATYLYGDLVEKGPDWWGKITRCTTAQLKNYCPVAFEAASWSGMQAFERFLPCGGGPFNVYRFLVWGMDFNVSDFCLSCPCVNNGGSDLVSGTYFVMTELRHWWNRRKLDDLCIYLLTGTPGESSKPLIWDEGQTQQLRTWADRQVVAFDYLVLGVEDLRKPRLFPNGKLWPTAGFPNTVQSVYDGGLGSIAPRFAVAQSRVYNGTCSDLLTQDWRSTLVPVQPTLVLSDALPSVLAAVAGGLGLAVNH